MSIEGDPLIRSWDRPIQELIDVTAKNTDKVENKQDQIVKGASKVFLKKGFHPTTMREISEAAGMSMGQMYHYVSSKDDVLFLIHRHLQIAFFKHMKKISINDDNAVMALTRALRHTQLFMVENKKLFQFVHSESKYLNKKHLRVVLQMDDKNIVEYWRRLIESINNQKGLEIDANFAANLIVSLSVFIPLRGWNLKDRPVKAQQEQLIEYILRAMGL